MKVSRTSLAAVLITIGGLFNLLGGAFCTPQPQVRRNDIRAGDSRVLQEQLCPLNLNLSVSKNCSEGSGKDAFQSSECCLEALTSFSQALAFRCNTTGQLFLGKDEETACAEEAAQRQWIDNQTCSIQPPAFTANDGGSRCYFAKLEDLKYAIGNIGFDKVATGCQDVQSQGLCSRCRDAFNPARTWLTAWAGGDNNTFDCQAALLVAIASLDIENQSKVQALYRCVNLDFSESNAKRTHGQAVLIALVLALALILIVVVLVYIRRRIQQKGQNVQKLKNEQGEGSSKTDPVTFQPPTSKTDPHSVLYSFSAKELLKATENYSAKNFLGEGSAGIVYRGSLPSGQLVAVKRINKEKQLDTFFKEVENLSRVRHPNLATLLGLCQTDEEHLLVYEYCSKGNLSQHLFGDGPPLTWEQRISIALGAAKGIWFLHLYPGGYIVHRDIKPTNILLNENNSLDEPLLEAKVADFGLSRFIAMDEPNVVTEVRGTTGYMDPEYINAGTLTFASDVYSLGVVILQLISGRKPFSFGLEGQQPFSLVKEAAKTLEMSKLDDLVDPRLNGIYSVPAYQKMLQIAVACTQHYAHTRPSMEDVLDDLDEAWRLALANPPQRLAPGHGHQPRLGQHTLSQLED